MKISTEIRELVQKSGGNFSNVYSDARKDGLRRMKFAHFWAEDLVSFQKDLDKGIKAHPALSKLVTLHELRQPKWGWQHRSYVVFFEQDAPSVKNLERRVRLHARTAGISGQAVRITNVEDGEQLHIDFVNLRSSNPNGALTRLLESMAGDPVLMAAGATAALETGPRGGQHLTITFTPMKGATE